MIDEIRGAIARGWCSPENSHKEMDSTLAEAISEEVLKLLEAKFTSDNSDYTKINNGQKMDTNEIYFPNGRREQFTDDELDFLKSKQENQYDTVVLQTNFKTQDIGSKSIYSATERYIKETVKLIDSCCNNLKDGGLIFIYGLPNYLSFLGEYLSTRNQDNFTYLFKYWIACEFKSELNNNALPASHIGLLMYLKTICF